MNKKYILKEAFRIELKTKSRGNRNKNRLTYGNEIKVIDTSWFTVLTNSYTPVFLNVNKPKADYLFFDSDDGQD